MSGFSCKEVFGELNAPLTPAKAQAEASRCYFCYDAPCIKACPTAIDIPNFIRKIQTGNLRGSALEILDANIMGGTCARACPVETLCQDACVRNHSDEAAPVKIGELQRYAVDAYFASPGEHPFTRAAENGKRVAVVGAGPAGLSCAHRLARLGYRVTVFEARPKSGGLNEYGLAPYKMTDDWAQKEVQFILDIGGIEVRHLQRLGQEIRLDQLRKDYDAVFLGIGLGSTHKLGIEGESLTGVFDAVAAIEKIRSSKSTSEIPIGRSAVVIGGGNTAIDIAVEMKKLGVPEVHLVYRRSEDQMGATWHEREIAKLNGVVLRTWAKPRRFLSGPNGVVCEAEFEGTKLDSKGGLVGTGEFFKLKTDQIFKAIGQALDLGPLGGKGSELPEVAYGKLVVDEKFQTTLKGVYAGGDCVGVGEDLTVTAVQQGKLAALAIHEGLANV